MAKELQQCCVYLSKDQIRMVKLVNAFEGIGMSQLLRQLLDQYFDDKADDIQQYKQSI